jgi:hypothetical protein
MSTTSPRGGLRSFPAIDADHPIEPMIVRDGVANNLLHLADQVHAKCWINDLAPNADIQSGNSGVLLGDFTLGAEWECVASYGPFDLSVIHHRGARYPYRVRAHLHATSLDVEWAVVLGSVDETASYTVDALDAPQDCMLYTSTGSSSSAWLAPTTASGIITPTEGLLSRCATRRRTIDGPGGSATDVVTHDVCVRVMARSTGEYTAELHGLWVAEYLALT